MLGTVGCRDQTSVSRRQFVSRAGIEHIAVHWQHNEACEPHHWFGAVACREGSWPMELPNPRPLLRPVTLRTFARLRHLSMSPHLWGTLNPDWRSGYGWLHLETPIVESAQSIERKFLARDHRNLTDKFAKSPARDALWRGFRRAQEEMDRLRSRHLPTIDFNIEAALTRLLCEAQKPKVTALTNN